MFCTSCGTKNMADSNFCKQCGHKLEKTLPAKISQEDYERALPEEEQVGALLERAYRLRIEGDTDLAISLCNEALRLRPKSTSAHSLLAQLYESIGERQRAIQELDIVLELNPASIADRIKRDELRDGPGAAPHHIVSPRFALTENNSTRSFSLLTLASLLIVFLAIGWAYTLVSRNHAASSGPTNGLMPQKTASLPPANATLVTPNGAQTASPTNNMASLPANNVPPANTEPPASAPYYGFLQPPIYVPIPTSGPGRATGNLTRPPTPTDRPRNPALNRPRAPEDPSRIVLENPDSGDSDNVVIPVGENGKKGSATKGKSPGAGNADTRDPGPTIIKITPAKEGSAAPPPDKGTTSNVSAQSMIAIASDYMKRSDYDHAITAYRNALPSAGDDTGYLYQQIAVCFQDKGDHASALTNYQHALSEFQRLKSAGRLKDRDSDGIRICQRGIQICSE